MVLVAGEHLKEDAGEHLKEEGAYLKVRGIVHIKFQSFAIFSF